MGENIFFFCLFFRLKVASFLSVFAPEWLRFLRKIEDKVIPETCQNGVLFSQKWAENCPDFFSVVFLAKRPNLRKTYFPDNPLQMRFSHRK
ncbi:MAG: hypothetical protein IKD12_03560 [Paludibacteraceae bacterium]|nr:hypothetical protein [Paludibacteraceae bacterium]